MMTLVIGACAAGSSAQSASQPTPESGATALEAASLGLGAAQTTSLPASTTAATLPGVRQDADAPKPWTVRIDPALWFVAASGELKLPVRSGNGPGSLTTDGDKVSLKRLDLDGTTLRPAGAFTIAGDEWRFSFIGAQTEINKDNVRADAGFRLGAVDIGAGDRFNIDFDFGSYELNLGYAFIDRYDFGSASDPDAVPVTASVVGIVGVRAYDVNIDFRRVSLAGGGAGGGPTTSKYSDLFVEPLIGARAEVEFTRQFEIDVQITGGYLPGSSKTTLSVDVLAGFTWRPLENVGLTIGYRQLAVELQDGDGLGAFDYDGRIAGLILGLTIQF